MSKIYLFSNTIGILNLIIELNIYTLLKKLSQLIEIVKYSPINLIYCISQSSSYLKTQISDEQNENISA